MVDTRIKVGIGIFVIVGVIGIVVLILYGTGAFGGNGGNNNNGGNNGGNNDDPSGKKIIKVEVKAGTKYLDVTESSQGYKDKKSEAKVFQVVDKKKVATNGLCSVPSEVTTFRLKTDDGKYLGVNENNSKAYITEDADRDRWTTEVFNDDLVNIDGINRDRKDQTPGLFPETKTDGVYYETADACQGINTVELIDAPN